MTNDSYWNKIYERKLQLNVWPFTDLVSLVNNYLSKDNSYNLNVLELGCGSGANSQIFNSFNFNYTGIDFSHLAISHAKEHFAAANKEFECMSIPNLKLEKKYDLIFDRASLTHLTKKELESTIDWVKNSLKLGGIFIGVDWFSKKHPSFVEQNGNYADTDTFTDFKSGKFKDVGLVQFFSPADIKRLFFEEEYLILSIQEKVVNELKEDRVDVVGASINFVVRNISE